MDGVMAIQICGASWTPHVCTFHVVLRAKVGLVPLGKLLAFHGFYSTFTAMSGRVHWAMCSKLPIPDWNSTLSARSSPSRAPCRS